MKPTVRAVVVDDHPSVCELIGTILTGEGVDVRLAFTAREGLDILNSGSVDVLFIDVRLPDGNGIEVLRECLMLLPKLAAVVVSGFGTMEAVVESLRIGACDYLSKPIDREKVVSALHRALKSKSPRDSTDLAIAPPPMRESQPRVDVVIASQAMHTVLARLTRIAPTSFPVLIQGETGVGKKLLARWVHCQSQFADGPFEHAVCAALRNVHSGQELAGWSDALAGGLQAMLRGHLTGGTLFLESIDLLPFPAQIELLDAIERNWRGEFGESESLTGIVRIIASTETDLESALSSGTFHRGLYDSLKLFPITVPPLRERTDDIQALATHFIDQFCSRQNRNAAICRRYISDELWELMRGYAWPGNVRELISMVGRVTLAQDAVEADRCLRDLLQTSFRPAPTCDLVSVPLEGDLKSIERSVIREVVRRHGGNKAAAARALGMHRRTLYRLLERDPIASGPHVARHQPANSDG